MGYSMGILTSSRNWTKFTLPDGLQSKRGTYCQIIDGKVFVIVQSYMYVLSGVGDNQPRAISLINV